MKRVAWILTVVGILGFAAGAAQAHGPYYEVHRGGYHGPVVVQPRVWAPPARVIVAPPPPPAAYYYQPPCRYRYYEPAPSVGLFYRGRNLSIGVGW
jgi:hypothetical protein